MSQSTTLATLVNIWRNQPNDLRTYSTLLAALKQWLADQRENHLGSLERVREEEGSRQRLDSLQALQSLLPMGSVPLQGA
eukprot:5762496-Alexandrium_andersonii.AAC.1